MGNRVTQRRRLVAGPAVAALLLLIGTVVWGRSSAPAGTIAYSRGNQLRLISPAGDEDRLLWAADPGDTIRGLDWRPDGGALAFASDLEADCSVYHSDIYTLLSDGLGLRRATNSPLCAQTADFPTGNVTLTIDNRLADYSAFQLYIQGAPRAAAITVAPGTTKTVTIKDVADLGGALAQRIVVIREDVRWYDPAVTVNVVAGTTAAATAPLVLSGDGARAFGAAQPAWQFDGAAIGFVFGAGELRRVAPYPVVAEPDTTLVPDAAAELVALSPITTTILFAAAPGIYAIEPDEADEGALLVANAAGQAILGLDWLPDGSGFVYSQTDEAGSVANLAQFDLETAESTPLTSLSSGFLRHPGVAPDGSAVVFERAARPDSPAELWLMALPDGELTPLGVIGAFPDWRPQRETSPFAFFYMPLVGNRMIGVTPTPTATPTQTPSPTPPPTQTPRPTATAGPATATPQATATAGATAEPTATAQATATSASTVAATATPAATVTATPAASLTPSPTPANLPPLKNGDFEAGPNGDWTERINNVAAPGGLIVRSEPFMTPRSGDYVVWLGNLYNQIHALSQPVTLTGAGPLYVQFYYRIESNETVCTVDTARLLVNSAPLATFNLCSAENSTGWERATVDLGAHLGQTVTLSFEGSFDERTASSFYIDDVSFVRTP
jgi:hypothetical protein